MTHLGRLIDRRLNEMNWQRQQLAEALDIIPVSVLPAPSTRISSYIGRHGT
jgi:hypothetical protein